MIIGAAMEGGSPRGDGSYDAGIQLPESSPPSDGSFDAETSVVSDAADAQTSPRREHESCDGIPATCGTEQEDCCTSLLVPGGTFLRDYDGVLNLGPEWYDGMDPSYPVEVSAFRLDKFEVTVGRFRKFVEATIDGWSPALGAGKHAHLNGRQGLALTEGRGYEPGFFYYADVPLEQQPTVVPPKTRDEWNFMLSCELPIGPIAPPTSYRGTWAPEPGDNENKPINCVNWSHAYAFCIWDGGFLPSEAEWNYAATGGDEQRVYPWSNPPGSTAINCSHANIYYTDAALTTQCGQDAPVDVGSHPTGNGRWGHADLTGNLEEWTLDLRRPYTSPCRDCADAIPWESDLRASRGGSFHSGQPYVLPNYRNAQKWAVPYNARGFRCARPPESSD